MKKIILLVTSVVFGLAVYSQPGSLDTSKSNLTIKASELAYYISYLADSKDSADIAFVRTLRTQVQGINNLTWNTNITINNLAGKYIVAIYDIGKRIPAGEALQLGVTVLNTIAGLSHPVIQYYVGLVDSRYSSEFLRHRTIGKNVLIDN